MFRVVKERGSILSTQIERRRRNERNVRACQRFLWPRPHVWGPLALFASQLCWAGKWREQYCSHYYMSETETKTCASTGPTGAYNHATLIFNIASSPSPPPPPFLFYFLLWFFVLLFVTSVVGSTSKMAVSGSQCACTYFAEIGVFLVTAVYLTI